MMPLALLMFMSDGEQSIYQDHALYSLIVNHYKYTYI